MQDHPIAMLPMKCVASKYLGKLTPPKLKVGTISYKEDMQRVFTKGTDAERLDFFVKMAGLLSYFEYSNTARAIRVKPATNSVKLFKFIKAKPHMLSKITIGMV